MATARKVADGPPRKQLRTRGPLALKRPQRPRRDNRKSRFDADYTGDDERYNEAFEAYYRAQRILPEEEYEALLATLATPLPTSFRVTADGAFRDDIISTITGEMSDLFRSAGADANLEDTAGADLKPPSRLPWYPDGLAWTVSAPRQMLRRDNVLSPFHKFLVRMNDLGAINRQEAVSMIPPLLLDARPGHAVLDMCASPGSKTAQILEGASPRGKPLSDAGVIIANDADIKRCWMLAHQLKRFGSADLVVTHHDAQNFPKFMSFDRILCDVPCTGDGTMRKAPDIWRRWTPDVSIGIHRLQRQILERGIELLKPGGRLVYSTCSMNPLENEAVVAHALRTFGDDVELVDCSKDLPGLVRRPGLHTWMVKNNSGNLAKEELDNDVVELPLTDVNVKREEETHGEITTRSDEKKADEDAEKVGRKRTAASRGSAGTESDEIKQEEETGRDKSGATKTPEWFESYDNVPHRRQKKIVASLFPPSAAEMECGRYAFDRCMRLMPHDQDTGGFFVAVFHKKETAHVTRREKREALAQTKEDEGMTGEARNSAKKEDEKVARQVTRGATRLITEDPLVSVNTVSPSTLQEVTKFFGLDAAVMEHCLVTRGSDDGLKRMLAVSRSVRSVLRHAIGTKDAEVTSRKRAVRVVNAGVRVLERTDRRDTTCGFRLVHDGTDVMGGAMSRRVASVSRELGKALLADTQVSVSDGWAEVAKLGSGSALLRVDGLILVVWVGRRVIQLVMPRDVVNALRFRFDASVSL